MKGRDRNEPCWCGSGKKFKKCHLGRSDQPKENPWAAVEVNKKAFKKKKCCAFDVGLGSCEGGVIKAHTVSRGPNLTKIAKNGHVLKYTANVTAMNRNGGKLSVDSIGISDASVFYGFCRKHDRELFSCIENEQFIGRPDQCLAVAYRTISRELYGKDASADTFQALRGADKGKPIFEQIIHQKWLQIVTEGNTAAQSDMKATHDAMTNSLVNSTPEIISSFVFEFSGQLPFMFAGAWSPFTDFFGKKLQDGYLDELLEQVLVSSFAGTSGTMICFSWRDIDGAPGKVIAKQINSLPVDQQASACLQIVAKHVENIFFNPDWFNGLSHDERKKLDALSASGLDEMGGVPLEPVWLEMGFGLPILSRSFEV